MDTKDQNIEQLDSNSNTQSVSDMPAVTIVNRIPVVETVTATSENINLKDSIKIEYNEYRNELNNIYCTTTEENSVISEFVVEDNKCSHTITMRQLNGTRNILLNREFDYTNQFREVFLVSMIEDYNKYNSIFDSNVTAGQNDFVNFTIRTKENDTLIIRNIDMDLASKLNDILYEKKVETPVPQGASKLMGTNDKGIGNTFVIILTILLIGLTLIGTIFFTIMSNR
ncbi:MAG: hypothetical protein HFJ12_01215 [Bacilli bacterium]|nr:hypothetical protein [Bacilli bacterium]